MKIANCKIFVVGETTLVSDGRDDFFKEIGVPLWGTDAASDSEELVEIAGKNCYQSFDLSLNENLTKVGARNNHEYIQQGIISTKHGSVLEHVSVSIIATDVSRVLTHELVRHRPGSAYSQQSGRYVRTDTLSMYIPPEIMERPELLKMYVKTADDIQASYMKMVELSGINEMKDFDLKKRLTSALRRIRPNGESNSIMFTYNHRAYRHLIEVRTASGAEEEIRVLFNKVYEALKERYPSFYADAQVTPHELPGRANIITFLHSKV